MLHRTLIARPAQRSSFCSMSRASLSRARQMSRNE